jgi:peptidyl-prolyl cis-trans isomerase B (cyclophilin B)
MPFLRGSLGALGLEEGGGEGRLFFTFLPVPLLDGRFPLIARVIDGMETIDRIEEGDRIESVAIVGAPEEDPDWKHPAR